MATAVTVGMAVICCGNRFYQRDALGLQVFDYLAATELPDGIALIDGGIAGLNLLPLMSGKRRVVLVDALERGEFGVGVQVLNREALAALAGNYGHGAGLPYLAAIAPQVLEPLPEILLVGSDTGDARMLAKICIKVALYGHA